MSATTRVVSGLVATAFLTLPAPVVWAAHDDGPTTNELELKFDRVEHAQRADVTGLDDASMLFDAEDSAALAKAALEDELVRKQQAMTLFVGPAVPYRSSASVTDLFTEPYRADASAPGAAAGVTQDGGRSRSSVGSAALAGLGVLLGAGVAASYLLRERNEDPDGE